MTRPEDKGATGSLSPHLEPSKFQELSTGISGVMASELASEEERLLQQESNSNYDSANQQDTSKASNEVTEYALPRAKLITVLTAMYCASFMNAADATIVSTLLSVIASDLDQIQNMSWIATAYLLSSATFQPVYGKLSDIFGRKQIILMCAGMFSLGCFITSFKSFPMVVIGRFITGMGGSGFNTVGTISLSDMIPLRDRGLFQGLANVAFLFGAASGGILGGVVNDLFGWQWVFIVQVPISICIGLSFYRYFELPPGSAGLGSSGHIKEKLKRVDFLGSFFLVLTLVVVLLAASMGNQYFTYTSLPFFGMMVLAAVLFSTFIYVEFNVSPEPILPLQLMSERTILASSLTNGFSSMATFTNIFYYPLFLSTVLQLKSSKVGLRLISNFLGVASGSVSSGLYMRKTGRYYNFIVACSVLFVFGIFNFNILTRNTPVIVQLIVMAIPGYCYAVILTITLLALIAAAPVKFQAGTTSIQYTFRSVGSTIGVSISSAIFQDVLRRSLESKVSKVVSDPKEVKHIISEALKSSEYAKVAPEYVKDTLISCYDSGVKGAFKFSFVMAVLSLGSTLFIREHKLHTGLNRD